LHIQPTAGKKHEQKHEEVHKLTNHLCLDVNPRRLVKVADVSKDVQSHRLQNLKSR